VVFKIGFNFNFKFIFPLEYLVNYVCSYSNQADIFIIWEIGFINTRTII